MSGHFTHPIVKSKSMELTQLQYPIGQYRQPDPITPEHLQSWTRQIAGLPGRLEAALTGLTDAQLDTPYRPGGWTVRQLVHHIADSHLNACCRVRLALTEDSPNIKPYDQDEWVKLPDAMTLPVGPSLNIIRGVHARWAFLLSNLDGTGFLRSFVHPEYGTVFTIASATGLYAWHGGHHLAHILELKKRNGW